MINYNTNRFPPLLLLQLRGSVLPKTMLWGIPSAVCGGLLHTYYHDFIDISGLLSLWSGLTFVLGFCLVFFNNEAFSRYQVGSILIQEVRGEWFNAASSVFAFSSTDAAKRAEVEEFQHLIIRLMSMLHCAALQEVAEVDDDNFQILNNSGIDTSSLRWLAVNVDRCEIITQWIQRLCVKANTDKILDVPAPLLSRSFQEMSRGMVKLSNLKRIKEVPFPFPYVQVATFILIIHWAVTPAFASQVCSNWMMASALSLVLSCSYWALYYIAREIEQPFGEDPNDLPLGAMQRDFNRSLAVLIHPKTQVPPQFTFNRVREMELKSTLSNLDKQWHLERSGTMSFLDRDILACGSSGASLGKAGKSGTSLGEISSVSQSSRRSPDASVGTNMTASLARAVASHSSNVFRNSSPPPSPAHRNFAAHIVEARREGADLIWKQLLFAHEESPLAAKTDVDQLPQESQVRASEDSAIEPQLSDVRQVNGDSSALEGVMSPCHPLASQAPISSLPLRAEALDQGSRSGTNIADRDVTDLWSTELFVMPTSSKSELAI